LFIGFLSRLVRFGLVSALAPQDFFHLGALVSERFSPAQVARGQPSLLSVPADSANMHLQQGGGLVRGQILDFLRGDLHLGCSRFS
jgi:hypothetical protein